MKQEEANRLHAVVKNIFNIQILLGDLLMPISAMIQKYKCTQEEAVNIKLKAEDYLTKYGCMTLDSSFKAISELIKNVDKPQTTTTNVTNTTPKIIQQKVYTPNYTSLP